ncbi:CG30460, partial [Drosophila busckii]
KQQQQLSKINKRHSRGIYEEYQQLNELLNGEKLQTICSENQMQNEMPNENENENKYGNVFEQQPPQSSFNSTALTEAQQLQQQQQHAPQLSTFTRVRNTFSLRRSSNNSNNNNKNVKPTNMESDTGDDEQLPGPPPGPLTTGHSVPVDEHVSSTGTDLTPCPNCSRTFNLSALRKHVVVCEKMTKKRKVFDSSRQRRDGTALSTYVLPKNFGLPNAEKASGVHTPPAASREASTVSTSGMSQSMQEVKESPQMLRRTTARTSMRKPAAPAATEASPAATAATVTATAAPAAAGAPPLARDRMRSSDRSLARRIQGVASERCPHCERSFNPKAFDRHVEWCKEKAIQATIKSSSTTETSKAKERMEARKQYRPPNLKTKRSINRDKYSNEEQYEQEMVSPKQYTMSTSSMASSVHSDNSQKSVKTSSKSRTIVTQNTVSLHMTTDDINVSNQDRSRRKAGDTCQQIDDTMKRLKRTSTSQSLQNAELDCVEAAPLRPIANRRNKTNRQKVDSPDNQSLEDLHAAQQEQTKRKQQTKEKQGKQLMRAPTSESLQLAKLDCEEAAPLKPVAKRTTKTQRQKIEAAELLAGQPQVTMTFDELNGLIKRKGSAAISNLNMNMAEPEPKIRSKLRTSTSLVRQARRRNSAKENPDFDVRCIDAPPMTLSKCELAKEVLSNEYQELEEIPRKLYADYESKSSIMPHGEIQIKLEASSMSRICRPKKRNNLPAIAGNAQPLRALPMPEIKQSLEALGVNLLPRLEFSPPHKRYDDQPTDDEDDELDAELDINEEAYEEANIEIGQLLQKAKLLEEPYDYDTNDIAEDLQDLESEDEQVDVDNGEQEQEATVKLPPISRRLVVLEQDEDGTMYIKAHKSKKRGSSKSSSKTSGFSSLAGDKYDPFLSAKRQLEELCTPNTPPDNELPTPTATTIMSSSLTGSLTKPMTMTTPNATSTPKATAPSNFRRTASLRGPRRTPLLPSRPLFATNYRPTIQRGLSDEGPISSNFLKPEEYDEMPVRAACGNDFHSPRVVRRDTSASNRKQQLKLPLSAANESQPQRNVAKTDSLAVFLKYEHELEQLNAKAAEVAAKNKELSSKELKDKSNNLSKQNSAKNLNTQLPPLIKPSATPSKENNENLAPLRLEPLLHKPSTPNVNQQPIKLEHIFGGQRLAEFIDPKLINACDNLNVCATSSEASSTPQTLLQSRSSSQSTITQERRHSGEARNLLKRKMRLGRNQFLYDASPEEAGSCADDEGNRSSLEFDEQCWQQQQKQQQQLTHTLPTPSFDDFDFEEFLSSFAQEHDQEQFPLFRDCREFLLNRTTSRQRSCQKASSTLTPTLTTTTPTATPRQPQFITPPSANSLLPSAHRSTGSNDSGSVSSEKSASNSRYATASSSSGGGGGGSADEKSLKQDESQKREIFISIETEPNAQGSSPISPDSLRHMVGNAQTPIDVLHIENGNEPEHAKFSKISDNEEQQEAEFAAEASRIPKRRPATAAGSSATLPALSLAPNVEANNAKNAFERMRNDFQQLGEQIGASVRRDLLQRQEQVLQQQQQQQIQAQQQELKANSPLTPSPSGDSDEQSSLDGYPMSSSHSSHHGVSFKNSTDSAYGSSNSPASLSRQRSSEIQLQSNNNNNKLLRPHTASGALSTSSKQSLGVDAITQAQCDYGKPLKARQRMFAG